MSVQDIIKKSFLDGFNSDVSTINIIVTLTVAMALGILVFLVYKVKNRGELYSRDFNIILIGLPIVTAAIVLAMQASIVISLGMVGALSIVRFRNAVKNSLDLLYCFWAISIGIICGAGIFEIAVILSLIMTVILCLIDLFPVYRKRELLVLTVTPLEDEDLEIEAVYKKLKDIKVQYRLKSKNYNKIQNRMNVILEVKGHDDEKLISALTKIQYISNIQIMSAEGVI